ncbi:MAG: response regulator transcription factor [Oscillospiraceae bacterium]|nr:response regulator transcription factor [Oscillospiraceae bacterium]
MKVLIVDDDNLVSISLKTILEATGDIEIVGIGQNGEQAIELYEKYMPDILLMDIRMDKMSGLDAAKIIMQSHPCAKILFLTTFADDDYIVKALNIGAKGYILKQNFESIAPSLHAVEKCQTVFGGEVITKIPSLMNTSDIFNYEACGISKKEYELLGLVAQGLNNKEISEKLYLSEGTIRNYISVLLEKLDLRDRTQLAIFYYQNR